MLTFELIKEYYTKGYYSKIHLKELYKANYITETQYFSLTGSTVWDES